MLAMIDTAAFTSLITTITVAIIYGFRALWQIMHPGEPDPLDGGLQSAIDLASKLEKRLYAVEQELEACKTDRDETNARIDSLAKLVRSKK